MRCWEDPQQRPLHRVHIAPRVLGQRSQLGMAQKPKHKAALHGIVFLNSCIIIKKSGVVN